MHVQRKIITCKQLTITGASLDAVTGQQLIC
jgi:hypothetical protein